MENKALIHVTRVSEGGVYGHSADHCDEAGCNGAEAYYPELSAKVFRRGDIAEPCLGEAHGNPHIDNCSQCAPGWGWVRQ